MRWSLDGAPIVEGVKVTLEPSYDGDRRSRLTGATPVHGDRPVVYTEFGRGAAVVEVGTYDCAASHAVVLVVRADGTKVMTPVAAGPSRSCKVIVDQATEVPPPPWDPGRIPGSSRRVTGHIEAEVGPRDDAHGPITTVTAAFAMWVIDLKQL